MVPTATRYNPYPVSRLQFRRTHTCNFPRHMHPGRPHHLLILWRTNLDPTSRDPSPRTRATYRDSPKTNPLPWDPLPGVPPSPDIARPFGPAPICSFAYMLQGYRWPPCSTCMGREASHRFRWPSAAESWAKWRPAARTPAAADPQTAVNNGVPPRGLPPRRTPKPR